MRAGTGRLERTRDAFPHRPCPFPLFLPPLLPEFPLLLPLVLLGEQLLDFSNTHTCTYPPPPAQKALPKHDGPHQFWHPSVLVLFGYVKKVERGGYERQRDGTSSECGRSTVRAPCLLSVDEEPPDNEGEGEEKGQSGIADVAGILGYPVGAGASYQRKQLHDSGYDSERTEGEKDKFCLEIGGIEKGEEMYVSNLDDDGGSCVHGSPRGDLSKGPMGFIRDGWVSRIQGLVEWRLWHVNGNVREHIWPMLAFLHGGHEYDIEGGDDRDEEGDYAGQLEDVI